MTGPTRFLIDTTSVAWSQRFYAVDDVQNDPLTTVLDSMRAKHDICSIRASHSELFRVGHAKTRTFKS